MRCRRRRPQNTWQVECSSPASAQLAPTASGESALNAAPKNRGPSRKANTTADTDASTASTQPPAVAGSTNLSRSRSQQGKGRPNLGNLEPSGSSVDGGEPAAAQTEATGVQSQKAANWLSCKRQSGSLRRSELLSSADIAAVDAQGIIACRSGAIEEL